MIWFRSEYPRSHRKPGTPINAEQNPRNAPKVNPESPVPMARPIRYAIVKQIISPKKKANVYKKPHANGGSVNKYETKKPLPNGAAQTSNAYLPRCIRKYSRLALASPPSLCSTRFEKLSGIALAAIAPSKAA